MNKQKIILRFAPGTGGLYLKILLYSIYELDLIKNTFSGHNMMHQDYHNGIELCINTKLINTINSTEISQEDKILEIQKIIKFAETPRDFYVIPVHLTDIDPLIEAFDNNIKIINITHTSLDHDQMAFNLVKKNLDIIYFINNNFLTDIQQRHNKFTDIKKITRQTDEKLLTYIVKFGREEYWNYFIPPYKTDYPIFNISFSDIFYGKFADRVHELIEFLEIDCDPIVLDHLHKKLLEYAESQKKVPYSLSIDDY